jgi:hypothetical protein
MDEVHPIRISTEPTRGSTTVAYWRANGGATLAAIQDARTDALLNLGINDTANMPTEAQWESDYAFILDALHTKWPLSRVFCAKPWGRGATVNANILAGWIDNVLATRGAWAFPGPDERVVLENGDDGVTYTYDGTHYNEAGKMMMAQQWKSRMGY